jgi:hypothetical protein
MFFTLFPMRELHFVTVAMVKCFYAMVDYFKEIRTLAGPIKCTSMVTRIALNLGCLEMAHVSYIEEDVPTLGLDHFVHTHILGEEIDYSIFMLFARDIKVLRLPDLTLALYSCHQLTL